MPEGHNVKRGILPATTRSPVFENVLTFTNEQNKYRIRLLGSQYELMSVWKHNTHQQFQGQNTFVKSLCTSQFSGDTSCPLCAINAQPQYASLENKDRPHPKSSEWVQAVYVHELKAVKLLIGSEVWTKINTLAVEHDVDVFAKDLSVVRIKEARYTYSVKEYDAQPIDLASICASVDVNKMIADYVAYLKGNTKRALGQSAGTANEPIAQPATPAAGILPSVTPAPQTVKPLDLSQINSLFSQAAQAAVSSAQPVVTSNVDKEAARRKVLNDKLVDIFSQQSDKAITVLPRCLGIINDARVAQNSQAKKAAGLDDLTNDELDSFLVQYQQLTK